MERIALEAESRINQMMAKAKRTGTHFPHLNRDIQALASLKKSILKQREWELQHGDLIRAEHEINMAEKIAVPGEINAEGKLVLVDDNN